MTDTTENTTTPFGTRRAVMQIVERHPRGVSDNLLVSAVVARGNVPREVARDVIHGLAQEGRIYRAGDEWKPTRLTGDPA